MPRLRAVHNVMFCKSGRPCEGVGMSAPNQPSLQERYIALTSRKRSPSAGTRRIMKEVADRSADASLNPFPGLPHMAAATKAQRDKPDAPAVMKVDAKKRKAPAPKDVVEPLADWCARYQARLEAKKREVTPRAAIGAQGQAAYSSTSKVPEGGRHHAPDVPGPFIGILKDIHNPAAGRILRPPHMPPMFGGGGLEPDRAAAAARGCMVGEDIKNAGTAKTQPAKKQKQLAPPVTKAPMKPKQPAHPPTRLEVASGSRDPPLEEKPPKRRRLDGEVARGSRDPTPEPLGEKPPKRRRQGPRTDADRRSCAASDRHAAIGAGSIPTDQMLLRNESSTRRYNSRASSGRESAGEKQLQNIIDNCCEGEALDVGDEATLDAALGFSPGISDVLGPIAQNKAPPPLIYTSRALF